MGFQAQWIGPKPRNTTDQRVSRNSGDPQAGTLIYATVLHLFDAEDWGLLRINPRMINDTKGKI